jgi:hypothetical protein
LSEKTGIGDTRGPKMECRTLEPGPWVLGGIRPSREDLTLSILLAVTAGFLIMGTTVMNAFFVRLESDP